MSEKFKGRYTVENGGVSNNRPHYFTIDASDLDSDMSQKEIEDLFHNEMQDAFNESNYPEALNHEDFIYWAKEQIAKKPTI
jgi:hypothetical protein